MGYLLVTPAAFSAQAYFTSVMDGVEALVRASDGRAAVLIGHSLGCRLVHYFCSWVAASELGRQRGGRRTHWPSRSHRRRLRAEWE